jgi:uncharacterized protein (TIGR02996 family)
VAQRRIVFLGNCQALALQRFCQRFLAPRRDDGTSAIDIAAYDVAQARRQLDEADVIVEQVFDHPLDIGVAIASGAGKVIRFPNVYAVFYWPYTNQRHPRNDEIGKGYDEGPYPNEMGDSFLNRLIAEKVPAEEAAEIYLREDMAPRADRIFELNADMQQKRDAAAGLDVQSHVARHFRDDYLFRTSAHPNMRIFSVVAEEVFGRLGYTKAQVADALAAQRVAPFPQVALPIHPGVIQHFGLRFANAETRYPYFDEGGYSFAEYIRRYVNFEWNAALRDAFRLAASDPEGALAALDAAVVHSPRSAAAARVKADLLVQRRDYAAAVSAARRAVALDDADLRNWLALARAYRLAGAFDDAREALARAGSIAPRDAEVRIEAAHLASAGGLAAAAVDEARRAADIEPGTARFHAVLSEFLVQAGRVDEAADAARQALALDPAHAGHRLALADRLERQGHVAEALAAIRGVIAEGAGGVHAHVRLAQVSARAGDLDGAEAAFRQAIAMAPENPELRLALADILDRNGKSAEAAAILAALTAANPEDAHLHARLGHFLGRAGDVPAAEAALRRAVGLAPGDAGPSRSLVALLHQSGRHAEALAAVQSMTAAGHADKDTLGWLGHLLAQSEDFAGAEAAFRRAVAAAPGEARFLLALIDMLDRNGRTEEALAMIGDMVASGMRDRHTLGRLGHLHARLSDFAAAEAAYRQAIDAAPEEAGFRLALADMLDRQGRTAEALTTLRVTAANSGLGREVYQRLGDLLMRCGDSDAATAAFRRAEATVS